MARLVKYELQQISPKLAALELLLKNSVLIDVEDRPPGTSWVVLHDCTQASEGEIKTALFALHAVELEGVTPFQALLQKKKRFNLFF